MNAQSVVVALTHVLHEHECAVVPGFGAFILRKNFGVANPFSGQIKPASYSVYFNADIKEDDGFVANALKEKFGLSFKQASQLLTDFVVEINGQTGSNVHFRLGVLGSFHRNPMGELFFLADSNLNLSLQSYGLPNIHWQWKVESKANSVNPSVNNPTPLTIEKLVAEKPHEETIAAIPSELTISEPTLIETNEAHHSDFTQSKRTQPLLWRAAASFSIISIGAGILMTVAQIWSVSSGQDLASLIPQDSQVQKTEIKPADVATNEVVSIHEQSHMDSSISHRIDYGTGTEGIVGFYESLRDMGGKYTVSGGSYITLELANRECLLWQKLGIDACVVAVKKSSLNKVVLGKFSDEQRASHFAESIKNMPTGTLSVSDVSLDWK